MRRAFVALLGLLLPTLATVPALAQPRVGPPPACAGRDLFTEMKTSDPKAYAEIRAAADASVNTRALLWRIDGKGQPASFLFGTVHVSDDRVHKLSPAVQSAFDGARKVALELAEIAAGPQAMAEAMQKPEIINLIVYQDGVGLTAHLTPAELAKLREVFTKMGIPGESAHLFQAWFAWAALALPPCEVLRTGFGLPALDQRLGTEAQKRDKPLIGLETVPAQIQAAAQIPEGAQIQLLKATLALIDQQEDLFEVMIRFYLTRDMGAYFPFFYKLSEKAGYDPAVLKEMEPDLIDKRNFVMRDSALPLLAEGSAFIAVGAAHLPGKDGLVELFRAAGYTVTAVE